MAMAMALALAMPTSVKTASLHSTPARHLQFVRNKTQRVLRRERERHELALLAAGGSASLCYASAAAGSRRPDASSLREVSSLRFRGEICYHACPRSRAPRTETSGGSGGSRSSIPRANS